jgi:hypothetical protein
MPLRVWVIAQSSGTRSRVRSLSARRRRPRADYDAWQKRDLSARWYVNMWADGSTCRPRWKTTPMHTGADRRDAGGQEKTRRLPPGCESVQTWRELLIDIRRCALELAGARGRPRRARPGAPTGAGGRGRLRRARLQGRAPMQFSERTVPEAAGGKLPLTGAPQAAICRVSDAITVCFATVLISEIS